MHGYLLKPSHLRKSFCLNRKLFTRSWECGYFWFYQRILFSLNAKLSICFDKGHIKAEDVLSWFFYSSFASFLSQNLASFLPLDSTLNGFTHQQNVILFVLSDFDKLSVFLFLKFRETVFCHGKKRKHLCKASLISIRKTINWSIHV